MYLTPPLTAAASTFPLFVLLPSVALSAVKYYLPMPLQKATIVPKPDEAEKSFECPVFWE